MFSFQIRSNKIGASFKKNILGVLKLCHPLNSTNWIILKITLEVFFQKSIFFLMRILFLLMVMLCTWTNQYFNFYRIHKTKVNVRNSVWTKNYSKIWVMLMLPTFRQMKMTVHLFHCRKISLQNIQNACKNLCLFSLYVTQLLYLLIRLKMR